jgi:hypothetical protein
LYKSGQWLWRLSFELLVCASAYGLDINVHNAGYERVVSTYSNIQ